MLKLSVFHHFSEKRVVILAVAIILHKSSLLLVVSGIPYVLIIHTDIFASVIIIHSNPVFL